MSSFNNRRPSYHTAARRPQKKFRGQYINPTRFVKAAEPLESKDYKAKHSFADFAIHPLLKSNIATKGYKVPSEIQDKTIPLGLMGKDVVGVANTGTGKTAAFAIPILNKLMHEAGSKALIIAPTRELAIQIDDQCRIYSKHSGLRGAVVIGGAPMARQTSALKANAQIVIGTPGRLKDHVTRGTLNLSGFNTVVLDEVDRMLDMGFINDIRFILSNMAVQRQSFFFSATLSPQIQSLIQGFTRDPLTVDVKVGDTNGNVNQNIVRYDNPQQRLDRLHEVLMAPSMEKALVFGETKWGVERLGKELVRRGFKVEALHGGKTQGKRRRALDSFRENRSNILVATDVAARGIDVVDITHVINFDVPHTYDDYVHRIGRAGRAGRPGHALTFIENA